MAEANPYLNARREWDERYGDALARAKTWRLAAFASLAVAAIAVAGITYVGGQSKIQPFVVALDKMGNPVAMAQPAGGNAVSQRIIEAQVANWVWTARSVIPDPLAQKALIAKVYAMAGSNAGSYLNTYYAAQGTRLIGEYSSQIAYGQSRVLVAWSRLIYPNGATIDLRGMEGTDGKGQAGFHDQVDNHYFRVFGSAILMSLLGVGAQLSQPQNSGALNTPSASQQAAAATAQQLNNVGTNLLNRNLNIQPTLIIRPGYAFNVLVNRTMILPPYGGR